MFNKCVTLLQNMKPQTDLATLERDAWEAVRDAVYFGTQMHQHIGGVREVPTASKFLKLNGIWKATTESKKGNIACAAGDTANAGETGKVVAAAMSARCRYG